MECLSHGGHAPQLGAGGYDYGEDNGEFDYNPNLQSLYDERDPHHRVHHLTQEQWDNLTVYTDAGVHDLFNFAVCTNHLSGQLQAVGQNVRIYDGFFALDNLNPEEDEYILPDTDSQGRPCFAVRALTRIEDFNDYFGCELTEEEDYDTIGGLVMHELGRLPRLGERLEYGGFEFRVTRADRRRIDTLKVARLDQEVAGAEG